MNSNEANFTYSPGYLKIKTFEVRVTDTYSVSTIFIEVAIYLADFVPVSTPGL